MIIPIVVWSTRGMGDAANVAQVVSIPLVMVSLGLAYWLGLSPTAKGQVPSPRRRAHGWAVVIVCFLCSALAIGAASTGRTAESVFSPEEPAPIGMPTTSNEEGPASSDQQSEDPRPRQPGDAADRPESDSGQSDSDQFQPGPSPSGQPDPEQLETEQPADSEQPESEEPRSEQSQPEQPDPAVLAERAVELSTQDGQESVEIDGWQQVVDQSGDLLVDRAGIRATRGAKLSIVDGSARPSYDQCAELETWTDQIDFASLQVGSQLCAQSSEGRYAMLQVLDVLPAPEQNSRFVFFGRTWELAS